jgi:hypothetical protein
MKTMKLFISMAVVAITAMLSAAIALADEFKTMDGKEYKDAKVTRVEPDGIVVKTKSGISKLYFVELAQDVQRRFNYNPQQASAYSAAQVAAYSAMETGQNGAENQPERMAPQNQPGLNQQEPAANNGAALQGQPTTPFYGYPPPRNVYTNVRSQTRRPKPTPEPVQPSVPKTFAPKGPNNPPYKPLQHAPPPAPKTHEKKTHK